jgi:hypothetical protein
MKTIQEQLAERIYEILPHKKELEFGCKIQFGFSSATIIGKEENGDYQLVKKQVVGSGDEIIVQSPNMLNILVKKYGIVGQPLRLADLLHAMYKSEDKNESKWSYIAGVAGDKLYFDAPSNNKAIVYNISQDNILSQSDEFCEWALQILK